ncbi:peptidoglycan-binding protein [Kitasatospora sp. NPDC059673]|uniref:peptidoglycan-binding domain-containing protein n=1 Tax=Kitasatospora sp. NPDC059673 TaxID=3346901 RepID=UPI00369B94DC
MNMPSTLAAAGANRYVRMLLALLAAALILTGLAAAGPAPAASATAKPSSKAKTEQEEVKEIQRRLVVHGYPVTVDGSYGARTLYAVQDFQRDHGLAPTGFVHDFAPTGFDTNTTFFALLAPPAKKPSRTPTRLTNTQAVSRLRAAGVTWHASNNGCMDKDKRGCTSFTDILAPTLDLAIDLKKRSGCDVTVTGGTEAGHNAGSRSHSEGYKIDIRPNPCIDKFITSHMFRGPDRGNDPRWLTHSAEYVLEHPKNGGPVHWDIKYTL